MISEEPKPSLTSPENTQRPVQIHMAGLPYNPNGKKSMKQKIENKTQKDTSFKASFNF